MPEDPLKQEPGTTGPAADPEPKVDPVPDPEPKPEPTNPLEVKLEGDKVPDKFQGKTLGEVIAGLTETQTKLTTAEQELAQWRAHYVAQQQNPQQTKQAEQFDPMKYLDEDQAKAVAFIVGRAQQPLLQGVGAMMKEFTRNTRPDFEDFEKRAQEIYDTMHIDYKFHPQYGWDYAYKLAKVEKEEPPKREPMVQPSASVNEPQKTGPAPLDETEQKWQKKMGMTAEKYREFGKPVDITKPKE